MSHSSAFPASDEAEKEEILARPPKTGSGGAELSARLRAGGPFQVAAYRSFAASEIADPVALDVVMALIEAVVAARQILPPARPRGRQPKLIAKLEWKAMRGDIRRQARQSERQRVRAEMIGLRHKLRSALRQLGDALARYASLFSAHRALVADGDR